MKGNELKRALCKTKGKVKVGMLTHSDIIYVNAEKSCLIKWAASFEERETGMFLEETNGETFLSKEEA